VALLLITPLGIVPSAKRCLYDAHPISEDIAEVVKGKGEVFLGDSRHKVREGDIIYTPCLTRHGTRNNREDGKPFICTGAAAPPQRVLYRLTGYL